MKPNCLVVWPTHLDYPVFRHNLNRFQKYFSSVWIAFSRNDREINLSNFVRASLPFCHFAEDPRNKYDWRDSAVNEALRQITTDEPICFIEQDFLIKDETFFEKVFENEHDFIYYQEGSRIHPAFAVVKRELVEKTSKDFSVYPPGDHFYKFFSELPKGENITDLGVVNKVDFYHMAGLSHNYTNFEYGDPFYHPANFIYYNYKNLQFPNQHPLFKALQQRIENVYGHSEHHVFLDNFFPI